MLPIHFPRARTCTTIPPQILCTLRGLNGRLVTRHADALSIATTTTATTSTPTNTVNTAATRTAMPVARTLLLSRFPRVFPLPPALPENTFEPLVAAATVVAPAGENTYPNQQAARPAEEPAAPAGGAPAAGPGWSGPPDQGGRSSWTRR